MSITSDPSDGPSNGPSEGPSDYTTLSALLSDYTQAGYVGQLRADDDGVHCSACAQVSPAEQIEIRSLRRLEGASDPADMAAVIATACPACSTLGTIVVMYGPEASEPEVKLLRRAQDHRFDDDQAPPSASPSESAGPEFSS
jgi:hypothetical protein